MCKCCVPCSHTNKKQPSLRLFIGIKTHWAFNLNGFKRLWNVASYRQTCVLSGGDLSQGTPVYTLYHINVAYVEFKCLFCTELFIFAPLLCKQCERPLGQCGVLGNLSWVKHNCQAFAGETCLPFSFWRIKPDIRVLNADFFKIYLLWSLIQTLHCVEYHTESWTLISIIGA